MERQGFDVIYRIDRVASSLIYDYIISLYAVDYNSNIS